MNEIIINKMEGQYNIIRPLSTSTDLSFYVVNVIDNYIGLSFGIKPHNKMIGQYDVFARPRIIEKLSPIRDAYIKEDVPTFNYGKSENLRVGIDKDGNRHRAFLLFDINEIEKDLYIISAKLKLKVASPSFTVDTFEISTSNNKFDEYGITWANQPARDQFIDTVEIYQNQQDIVIDITDTFMKWYEDKRENNGLILKEFEQIINREIAFFSRESGKNTPILEVEYLDPTFFIPLYHEIDLSFNVQKPLDKYLSINFEVESFYKSNEIPIDLFVLSIIGELCIDFTISQTVILLDFIVSQISDLLLEFKVGYPQVNEFPIEFAITHDNLEIDMNVAGINYLWMFFTVHHTTLPVNLAITKDNLILDFFVLYRNDIDIILSISQGYIPIEFEILMNINFIVTKNYIPIEFDCFAINDLPLLFHIQKYIYNPEDDLPIYVGYSNPSIPIYFMVSKYSDLNLEYNIRAVKDLLVNFKIVHGSSSNIDLDFVVRAINDLDIEIDVASRFFDIDFDIIKYKDSSRRLDFVVRAINDIDINFIVAQISDIHLLYHVQKHLFSDIFILFTKEGEEKRRGAYVFIM